MLFVDRAQILSHMHVDDMTWFVELIGADLEARLRATRPEPFEKFDALIWRRRAAASKK